MKNIRYIITIIFAFIGFSACIGGDDGYYHERRTEAGKMVYDNVEKTLAGYVEIINIAQKVSKYLHSEESERDSIKYYQLSGYDILEKNDDTLFVRKDGEEWLIKRNSKNSIITPSTKWEIEYKLYHNISNSAIFTITSQSSANMWDIEVENFRLDNDYITGNASLVVKLVSNNDSKSNDSISIYSIEVKDDKVGEITSFNDDDTFIVTYDIRTPLLLAMYKYSYLTKGELDIYVDRGLHYDKDHVKSKIMSDKSVSITLRGVTENWPSCIY